MNPQCIISVSSAHYQCIISTSSSHHQLINRASSALHKAYHQRNMSTSSAHHPRVLHCLLCLVSYYESLWAIRLSSMPTWQWHCPSQRALGLCPTTCPRAQHAWWQQSGVIGICLSISLGTGFLFVCAKENASQHQAKY